VSTWSGLSQASLALGQELTVTPLQVAVAYGALANGGWLLRPHLVARVTGGHETIRGNLPQHVPYDHWPVEPIGDLGMTPGQRHVQVGTGFGHLGENSIHQGCVGLAFRQQQRGQEPARRSSAAGHIVGIDVHRVPADFVGGEGDGIGLGDQVAVSHVNYRRIFAQSGADDETPIGTGIRRQQPGQMVGRQLTNGDGVWHLVYLQGGLYHGGARDWKSLI